MSNKNIREWADDKFARAWTYVFFSMGFASILSFAFNASEWAKIYYPSVNYLLVVFMLVFLALLLFGFGWFMYRFGFAKKINSLQVDEFNPSFKKRLDIIEEKLDRIIQISENNGER